jgi:hypothetical protein
MKKKTPLSKIAEVDIQIVKMSESSGNDQFFVRMVRNDSESFFSTSGQLAYSCWQTIKDELSKEECLARAWFDAGFVARFVGIKSLSEIKVLGLDEEEEKILRSSMTLFRENDED